MLKKLLFAAATAAAATLPPRNMASTRAAPSKVLLSGPSNIMIADFDGSKFGVALNKQVPGAPTWMAYAKPDLLYAVDENSATTSLFHIDLAGNKIEQSANTTGSNGVVHLAFNKDHTRMVGAAYGSSAIDVFDVSNGGLKYIKSVKSNDNTGPVGDRQEKAHPHQAVLDPTGRYFAVPDLGTDRILILDSDKDSFEVINHVPIEPAGCGPRHGAFFPAGAAKATHYIVLCEIKNVVNVYSLKYGGDKGIEFFTEQSISTFPSATPPKAAAGELVIAPDSKSVYASNRLTGEATDNIAHFRVVQQSAEGSATCQIKLELVGLTSTGGKLPRMFSISEDGQFVLVGNQDGDLGVVALKRNPDGTLEKNPAASIPANTLPNGKGPAFVQQA
ncbi:hypothetical protein QQS21_003734 [Conoideocrella luteorostrata]|uniref:6-phosphogluconolactonase n=1 Tax=Conoideocrella luteorostrata TaxID=1105319 RepID=A0AAJ0CSS8_9HYPO|nr:hypothetical protein QQS21_003734 [Conoideocrella luteorostrata]